MENFIENSAEGDLCDPSLQALLLHQNPDLAVLGAGACICPWNVTENLKDNFGEQQVLLGSGNRNESQRRLLSCPGH